jgi:hypothetical protein
MMVFKLEKCIFFIPFGTLLGHGGCKEGLLFNQVKIEVIMYMLSPTFVIYLCATLRHT